jgi:5-guanidino-2-oxopentanoate decarboxylase
LAHSNIRHILPRHEQGAGFMADGYARVSGKPGVCMLISGPGVTNAATALGQAYADSIPILLISSVTPTHSLGKGWGLLHEITDQQAVTSPLTAFSATIMAPEELPNLIGQAFSIFASSRPRPVHISIPVDVIPQSTEADWGVREAPARLMPNPEAIQGTVDLLLKAQRPVIFLGGGAINAEGNLTDLVEYLNAAVVCTNAGKGIVPDSHPLSLGASSSRSATRKYLLEQADVILAIGTELSETDTWVERLRFKGKLIRVDIDAAKIDDLYPADIGIIADAGFTVEALLKALRNRGVTRSPDNVEQTLANIRQQSMEPRTAIEKRHQTLLKALRKALPKESIVVGDSTQLVYTSTFSFPVEQPRSWIYPAGYCPLGHALPMVVGAKLAAPNRPAVALVGDGGFMFTVQELATAVELELPLPIILWNNDGLGQIRDGMESRGIPPIGVNHRKIDYASLSKAFGCRWERPESVDAFGNIIADALEAQVPTLIEIHETASWLI